MAATFPTLRLNNQAHDVPDAVARLDLSLACIRRPKATSNELAGAPVFFARPSFWKMVLVVGLPAFISYMASH
jgi:hypothetical protein